MDGDAGDDDGDEGGDDDGDGDDDDDAGEGGGGEFHSTQKTPKPTWQFNRKILRIR